MVQPGDPASGLVNALKRLNYSYVVLTTPMFFGILSPQPESPLATLDEQSASSPAEVIRAVRLADCLSALKKEGLLGNQ